MSNIDYTHIENNFVDFDRERLLFKMNSSEGPCLCAADFNQDGLDDIFIGSAKNQVSKIYYQIKKGEFKEYREPFENDLLSEDVNCVVDDFDGDGFPEIDDLKNISIFISPPENFSTFLANCAAAWPEGLFAE